MDDVAPPSPRIPRRDIWQDVPEYPGFRIKVWCNAPHRLFAELRSGDNGRIAEALTQLACEHNGWLDYDGAPYPPAHTVEFWLAIPTELASTLIQVAQAAASELPNSLARMRGASARGPRPATKTDSPSPG